MKKSRRKTTVTAELCESIARNLRATKITPAVAQALAPNLERLNNAALEAAKDSDFNHEPSRFASVLAQLKAPSARR
ncbi:MAG TPA: hypothetical protein VED01_18360 [Burkholderiales bacterium]|nr:hypothetical protein [Burkholderiales bacterium]